MLKQEDDKQQNVSQVKALTSNEEAVTYLNVVKCSYLC